MLFGELRPIHKTDILMSYMNHYYAKKATKIWKCWNAKFEKKSCTRNKVDGNLDRTQIK